MIPLTLNYCKENDLTEIDIIKHFRPKWNFEKCIYYYKYVRSKVGYLLEDIIDYLNKNLLPRKLIFLRHHRIILAKYIIDNSNFAQATCVKRYRYLKLISSLKNNLKFII